MNLDIALDAEALIESIENRVGVPCIPGSFGLGGGSGSLMFDHLEVSAVELIRDDEEIEIRREDGSPRTVDGHRISVRIDFRIHLADRSEVIAGGLDGAATTIPLELSASYDFVPELVVDDDGEVIEARLRAVFVSKSVSLPDLTLDQIVDEALERAGASAPIELGPLAAALDTDVRIRNFGITADAGINRIVMRLEIGAVDPSPVQAWRRFFDNPPNILGGRELAIRIDARLLVQVAEDRTREAIASSSELELLDGPVAVWLPDRPGLFVTTYIDAEQVCPNLDDISLDLAATATFSIESTADEARFQTSTRFTWDVNDADVAACVLALTGPFFWGVAFGPILDRVIAVVAGAIYADNFAPDSTLFAQDDCEVISSDDDHVLQTCRRPFEFTNDLLGTFLPDEILGVVEGLIVRGDRAPLGVAPIQPPGGPITVTPLGWETKLNCNTHGVDVDDVGQVRFRFPVCSVEVLTTDEVTGAPGVRPQPLPFFVVSQDSTTNTLAVGTTSSNAIIDAYYAAPYPCQLLVCTGAGPRFIDLGTMPAMPAPPNPVDVIEAVARLCLRAYDRFWRFRHDVEWLVDPAPDTEVLHDWEVVVLGLHELDAVEMVVGDRVVSRAGANSQGVARIRTVLPPAGGGVALRRVAGADAREPGQLDPARHRLVIAQRLLSLRTTLGLAGNCIEVTSFRGVAGRQLAVVTNAGLEVYGSDPVRTFVKRASIAARGLRGVVPVRDGILAYGRDGVRRFEAQKDGHVIPVGSFRDVDVTAIEAQGNVIVACCGDQYVPLSRAVGGSARFPIAARRLRPSVEPAADRGADWLGEALPVGPFLVHLDRERRHLRVYERGRTRLMTQPFERPA
jgi:hypothetical protein